jgi:hypothetical protein
MVLRLFGLLASLQLSGSPPEVEKPAPNPLEGCEVAGPATNLQYVCGTVWAAASDHPEMNPETALKSFMKGFRQTAGLIRDTPVRQTQVGQSRVHEVFMNIRDPENPRLPVARGRALSLSISGNQSRVLVCIARTGAEGDVARCDRILEHLLEQAAGQPPVQ